MVAEGRRHVVLLGVEVVDEATYARYRAEMTPILTAYEGSFGVDLAVEPAVARMVTLDRRG